MAATPARGANTRVLLVDDDMFVREVMSAQLSSLGVDVTAVANGQDALKQWSAGDFALLLTDKRMPDMSGEDLVGVIRAQEKASGTPPAPVIAVTGAADDGWRDAGFSDQIAKPVHRAELKAILERWL